MTIDKPRAGAQSIYDGAGNLALNGQWDPRELFEAISVPNSDYWSGKRVLDIGANTFGLSVEIARAGATVVAIEPDPYDWYFKLAGSTVQQLAADEGLSLTIHKAGLFEAPQFGAFDAALLLGIVYHFRDPQYLLDFLSTLDVTDVFVSTQTTPGDDLTLHNRRNPGTLPDGFFPDHVVLSGWHPTHALFRRMLEWAGFDNVVALTDPSVNYPNKPARGLTNSAYYRATKVSASDPEESRRTYYPR